MVSMTMMFAGLTSAFVVSKSRADWLKDFQLPPLLLQYCSNYGCSVTFHLAKNNSKNNKIKQFSFDYLSSWNIVCNFKFVGFGQIVENGYYFTGREAQLPLLLYVVTVVHLIHLAGGVISLLIIIYNHFKQKIQFISNP
jgi:cytochrome c oxidase subunit 3